MASLSGDINFRHEQYEPIDVIGRGGMGILLKCKDIRMQTEVAVKVLGWNFSNQEVLRFQQEAQALAQLRHPNIVNIIHFGHSEDDSLFIVMELLNGNTLDREMESDELRFEEALNVFIQICDGLAHAHGKGILHRDIKPSNLFLERKQNGAIAVTITDFGLAKLLSEDQRLTRTGFALGSPAYMSPEQIDGKMVDDRADLYSLGCVMFEVLTGKQPFVGLSVQSIFYQQMNSAPPSLLEQTPDKNFPDEIERIIQKCLKKNPAERYDTILDLRHDLKELQERLTQSYAEIESGTLPQSVVSIRDERRSTVKVIVFVLILMIPTAVLASFSLNKLFTKENPKNSTSEIIRAGVVDALKSSIASGELRYELKDRPITDEQMKVFAACTEADLVDLSNTAITDSGLQYLGSAKNLRTLVLNDTAVTTLEYLPGRDSLVELRLKGAKVTDTSLQKLNSFRRLITLDVRDTEVTANGIVAIRERKFDKVMMNPVSKADLAKLQHALPFCSFNDHPSLARQFETELQQLLTSKKDKEAVDRCMIWTKIAQDRGDKDLQLFCMTLTAQSLDICGRHKEAEVFYKKAIEFGELQALKIRLLNTYNFFLERSVYFGTPDDIVKHGKRFADLIIENGNKAGVPASLDTIAWRFSKIGRPQDAIPLARRAIAIQEQLISRKDGVLDFDSTFSSKQLALIKYQIHLSNFQGAAKQFDEARKTAAKARSELEQMDETFAAEHLCGSYLGEAQIEMDLKNNQRALELNDRALKLLQKKLSKNTEVFYEALRQRMALLDILGRNAEARIVEARLGRMNRSTMTIP